MDPVNQLQPLTLRVDHANDLAQHEGRDAVAVELSVGSVSNDQSALLVGGHPGDPLLDAAAVRAAAGLVSPREEGQGRKAHDAGVPAVARRGPASIFQLLGGQELKTPVDSPGHGGLGVDFAKFRYAYLLPFNSRIVRGLLLRLRGFFLGRERIREHDEQDCRRGDPGPFSDGGTHNGILSETTALWRLQSNFFTCSRSFIS